jgi:hypothetical protein
MNGLNYRNDSVCVCGHWGSTHRDSGTCEGFRCGCYTFRKVTTTTADPRLPRCPVCNVATTGKTVSVNAVGTIITTTWLHESPEITTKHTAETPIIRVGHGEDCSPGDCECGLGNNWSQGDRVPDGAGRVMNTPTIYQENDDEDGPDYGNDFEEPEEWRAGLVIRKITTTSTNNVPDDPKPIEQREGRARREMGDEIV